MEQSPFDPHRIDALVFDVIGTLVDEEPAWQAAAARLASAAGLSQAAELADRWAAALNDRMDAVIAGTAAWQPHRRLVAEAASAAISSLGGTANAATIALAEGLDREYRAWPEVAEVTAALRRSRLVAGVSNGDLDALARLANTNAISWDVALSTSAVHTFKPAPAAYRYAIDELALDPTRTLFVAAHPWDLRAAARHGFRTAYVARPGAERPAPTDRFDVEAHPDLTALATLLA
ncbi:haloacid dehalogenase type II [Herbiconiux sp. VKM Ac-2851]|uniref:haloacid dehalogenase type II n=1 Tax=Herbiconiux sp. VKM Ac-2851 TaxID=2739025 RepID=UPI001564C44F|nr:haloacid dehalogenase type II [Herbiconiux sp. VKM Ac-2851]NQX35531.1 haloacid dehalogenase type II [Herbiconiux sp. VKM Ac-2851]